MTEKDSDAKNGVKTFETSDDFLTFELMHYEEDWNQLNKYGDPEVIDVAEVFTAQIVHPDSGRILEGSLVPWGPRKHNGHSYVILEKWGQLEYFAARIEPGLPLDDKGFFQMRPVILHSPVRNEWEVFRNTDGYWKLIPGQHLKPKTATAQQWMCEMETQIIPSLDLQAADLLAERLKLQASHRAVNPTGEKPLSQDTAASNARSEWLGPDYKKACQVRKAAESRCAKTDLASRRHSVPSFATSPSWSVIGAWLTHGRKAKRLLAHAEAAQAWHQRVARECTALEARATTEKGQNWIKERTADMLNTDLHILKQLKSLEAEKEALAAQMSEAAKLTRLLKQQSPDTLVTMDQSQVPERRVQTVPVLHEESALKLQMTPSNRLRP